MYIKFLRDTIRTNFVGIYSTCAMYVEVWRREKLSVRQRFSKGPSVLGGLIFRSYFLSTFVRRVLYVSICRKACQCVYSVETIPSIGVICCLRVSNTCSPWFLCANNWMVLHGPLDNSLNVIEVWLFVFRFD